MNGHNARTRIYSLLGLIGLLAACSDGSGVVEQPTPDIVAPIINSFKVTKAGDSATSGAAITVNAGDGVEITWSVSGADKVELKSESGMLAQHEVTTDGTETVTDIQADETFVLTAYNQGLSVQDAVRVSVARTVELTVLKFEPTAATIEPGQSTTLCYEVQPAEAEVHVFDAAGVEILPAGFEPPALFEEEGPLTETPPDEEVLADGIAVSLASRSLNLLPPGFRAETPEAPETPPTPEAPEAPILPAVTKIGCTVEVMPAATMEYSLVATLKDADGVEQTVEQKTTVTVASSLSLERFVATDAMGNEITAPLTAPGKVTLEWVVKPADAHVEIDQGIGDVTAATVDGKGNREVEVTATTTYTMTASKEGSAAQTQQLTITLVPPTFTTVTLKPSSTSIFPGETVTMEVTTDVAGGTLPPDATVVLRQDSGRAAIPVQGNTVTVSPTATAAYVVEVKLGERVVATSEPQLITVRGFQAIHAGVATAIDARGTSAYFGMEANLVSGATRLLKQEGADSPVTEMPIAFIELFKKPGGWGYYADPKTGNDGEFKKFNPYTINAVATSDTEAGQSLVLVGMSGGLFFSTDGGKTVDVVDAYRYITKGDGTHVSCKGRIQHGRKSGEEKFGGVQQVCDVLILPSGKTVLAYDAGVITNANVVARAKDRTNPAYFWEGLPADGKPGNALFGGVSHDLVFDAAKNTVYVASNKGVYQSTDDAETFTEVGSLGEPAYAVAVTANGTVYAGTKDRIVRYASGTWETVHAFGAAAPLEESLPKAPGVQAVCPDGSTCVVSIVEEPSAPDTLYVGTGAGFHVLRNGKPVATLSTALGATAEKPVAVRAIAVSQAEGDIDIYVATSTGIWISHVVKHGERLHDDMPTAPAAAPPPEPAPESAMADPAVQ